MRYLNILAALLVAGSISGTSSMAATVDISATIMPQVAPPDQFEALDSTYTIAEGDTVNLNYTVAGGQLARFDVLSSFGAFYTWVEKAVGGSLTISNISLSLGGFSTDSAWDGTATKATETNCCVHLGPTFQFSDFGLNAGDYFQFSSINISFDVDSLGFASFETSSTRSRYNGATISYVAAPAVPVPAALPLMVTGLLGFGVMRRRRRIHHG